MGVFLLILGVAALIAGMIFLYRKVIPAKFDGTFDKNLFQHIHDYFNFKNLYIETVMKFLFTLLTVACVTFGAVAILSAFFGIFSNIFHMIEYSFFSFEMLVSDFFMTLLSGIAIAALGPIAVRLTYEGIMMFILLVKNTIEINTKLGKSKKNDEE